MSIHELHPKDTPEYGPGFHIVREVIELPEDFDIRMLQELKTRPAIERFSVEILLESDSYVPIISSEEVLNLHEALGRELTMDRSNDIIDFLTTRFPSPPTDRMTIELRPLDKRYGKEMGDLQFSQGRTSQFCNFRAPFHGRLQRQRRMAKEALYEFFDVDRESFGLDDQDIWEDPRSSDIGHLLVATAMGPSNIANMDALLTKTRVLPLGVTLGPLIVEKV